MIDPKRVTGNYRRLVSEGHPGVGGAAPGMKVCAGCRVSKQVSAFGESPYTFDEREPFCRSCTGAHGDGVEPVAEGPGE